MLDAFHRGHINRMPCAKQVWLGLRRVRQHIREIVDSLRDEMSYIVLRIYPLSIDTVILADV